MENLGFLAAIGAALAFGTFMVPFKIAKSDKLVLFQVVMSVGILLSGLVLTLILGYSLRPNIYGFAAGILWAVANSAALTAIFNLGLSRAVPLMSSLVVISAFLWGALVFGEMPAGMIMGFAGIALIILGVILSSATGNLEGQNVKQGLFAAVAAGLIFGSQLVPLKVGNVTTGNFFFSVSLGIFISVALMAMVRKIRFSTEVLKEGLISGVIWNIGNLLSLVSLSLIGLSKMGPISQTATLVAVFWGLFYFKEITKSKAKIQVLIGAVILLLGVIILGLA